MKYIHLLLSIILFTACNELKKETLIIEETIDTTIQITEPIIEEEITKIVYQDTTSHLEKYKIKLERSKYNFKTKSSNGSVMALPFYNMEVIMGRAPEDQKLLVQNIEKQVLHHKVIFIKGAVKISSDSYPRANIHEYIFQTDSIAQVNLKKLMELKNKNPALWEMRINRKCPSLFIHNNNRIYHVITGGWFMMGMEKEIAAILFD